MASVTIDFSSEHADRIKDALERGGLTGRDIDGDPLPPTIEDLKNFIVSKVTRFVQDSERQVARDAADIGVTTIDVT